MEVDIGSKEVPCPAPPAWHKEICVAWLSPGTAGRRRAGTGTLSLALAVSREAKLCKERNIGPKECLALPWLWRAHVFGQALGPKGV